MKTLEEGYELLCRSKEANNTFVIDAIACCVIEDYDFGVGGYESRQKIRRHRPAIYEELEGVKTLEDFEAVIARFRVEGL